MYLNIMVSNADLEDTPGVLNICSNPDAYMKSTEVKIDDPRNKYLKEGESNERLA